MMTQAEIEWWFLRCRRNACVGGEAFLYKWRSDGGVVPRDAAMLMQSLGKP